MTLVGSIERTNDTGLVGKLGQGFQYGERIYGKAHYGDEEIYNPASENGVKINGDYFFGDMDNIWGIYQRRHNKDKTIFARLKFIIRKIRKQFRNKQTEINLRRVW